MRFKIKWINVVLIVIISLSIMNNVAVSKSPRIAWVKTFGEIGVHYDEGRSVEQTADGGFIITGTTKSFGNGWGDVWLIKTDSNGMEQWNRTFGGSKTDHGYSVKVTNDDGYIIVGYTHSFKSYGSDILLIKTNSAGYAEWTQVYSGFEICEGLDVEILNDGGYIILGKIYDGPDRSQDVWLIHTSENGTELWNKTFGGKQTDCGYELQQTQDEGFIIIGYTNSFGYEGTIEFWLIKTDAEGNEVWNQTFGGQGNEEAFCGQQTSDGGFILGGIKRPFQVFDNYDFWMIKTDNSGNQIWEKSFGGLYNDYCQGLSQTADGGYILTGYRDFNWSDASWGNIWIIKTDAFGNEEWNITYGESMSDYARDIKQTTDGGYIVTGIKDFYANTTSGGNLFLMRLSFTQDEDTETPSFEFILSICAIALFLFLKRKKMS
jgi:hypothetical protein